MSARGGKQPFAVQVHCCGIPVANGVCGTALVGAIQSPADYTAVTAVRPYFDEKGSVRLCGYAIWKTGKQILG